MAKDGVKKNVKQMFLPKQHDKRWCEEKCQTNVSSQTAWQHLFDIFLHTIFLPCCLGRNICLTFFFTPSFCHAVWEETFV
jgi:hypothetical protein